MFFFKLQYDVHEPFPLLSFFVFFSHIDSTLSYSSPVTQKLLNESHLAHFPGNDARMWISGC